MPMIEIVCEGQVEPENFTDLPFAVLASTRLVSRRSPSRFQHVFDGLRGCIYHLGIPDRGGGPAGKFYFAYALLSAESRDSEQGMLQFARPFQAPVRNLLAVLLECSPAGSLVFTTDWQLGPRGTTDGGELTLAQFWHGHDTGALRLNGIYRIR